MQLGSAIATRYVVVPRAISHVRLGDAIGHGVDRLKSLNAQEARVVDYDCALP
jgi:hypothetical protein